MPQTRLTARRGAWQDARDAAGRVLDRERDGGSHRADARSGAVPSGGDFAVTLLETLVALVILGLAGVGFLQGFQAAALKPAEAAR